MPWSRYSPSPPKRSSSFSTSERILFGVAVLLLAIGIGGWWLTIHGQPKKEVPLIGGTFVEGVVADSPTKVDRIIASMTNIGLTYRDQDGVIQPALAKSWSISDDKKTYTFQIKDGYATDGLLAAIKSNKTNWEGIQITAPTNQTLQFTLPEPLSLFLGTTTQPLFPFGPYQIAKRDQKEVILGSNSHFVLGEPYISKVVVKIYATQDEMLKALNDDSVNASADFEDKAPDRFQKNTISLPRYYVLFFNMTRSALKKPEDRLRIINQTDGPEVSYTLLTNQSDSSRQLAEKLSQDLKSKHINLQVTSKNSLSLQKDDIPKRQFDLLIQGINYGVTPDYYPLWHSSQVNPPGLNISGVKDKELDKLLEAARHEPDPAKQQELTKNIADYLAKNGLQQILGQDSFNYWVDHSIKGVQYGKIDEGSERFSLLWRWYIKSKIVKK